MDKFAASEGIAPPSSSPCRTLDMDKFAAAHINGSGPTLKMTAEYSLPAGSEADPALDEEGKEIEGDVSVGPFERMGGDGRVHAAPRPTRPWMTRAKRLRGT